MRMSIKQSSRFLSDTPSVFYPLILRIAPDVLEMIDGQRVKIASITWHYRYKTKTSYHNMALIELESPAINAAPACLWILDEFDFQRFSVFGLSETGELVESAVTTVSTDKCHEYYNFTKRLRFGILSAQMCTVNARDTLVCPV